VFDDFFETVFSDGEQEPSAWPELVVFNSFANNFDDDDYQPELAAEWLNPVELEQRTIAEERERERLVRGKQPQNQREQQPPTTVASQRSPTAPDEFKTEQS
jgi:hypothetical protein